MCYPVCGVVHIKVAHVLVEASFLYGYLRGPLPYVRQRIQRRGGSKVPLNVRSAPFIQDFRVGFFFLQIYLDFFHNVMVPFLPWTPPHQKSWIRPRSRVMFFFQLSPYSLWTSLSGVIGSGDDEKINGTPMSQCDFVRLVGGSVMLWGGITMTDRPPPTPLSPVHIMQRRVTGNF